MEILIYAILLVPLIDPYNDKGILRMPQIRHYGVKSTYTITKCLLNVGLGSLNTKSYIILVIQGV